MVLTMRQREERESVILENEGQKIFGVLHLPVCETPVPLVLICHGLAGTKIGRQRMNVRVATQLTQANIAVLRFDFRGCGDSEGDLSEMTLEGEVSDALCALDFVKTVPGVDAERIGILGRSLGGAVAVLTASRRPVFKRMVLWAPLFSGEPWRKEWEIAHTKGMNEEEMSHHFLVEGQRLNYTFFEQMFSMQLGNEIEKLKHVPLLHIHSEDDQIVTIDHAKKYRECREDATAESKYIPLHQSRHDFCDPMEQQLVMKETVTWFENL